MNDNFREFRVEIGESIQFFMKKNELTLNFLILKMMINTKSAKEILESEDLDVQLLIRICRQLKFNFFDQLSEKLTSSDNLFNTSDFFQEDNFDDFSNHEIKFVSFILSKIRNNEISMEETSENFGIPMGKILNWMNISNNIESPIFNKISISNIIRSIVHFRKLTLQDLSIEMNKSVKDILIELEKEKFNCRSLYHWSKVLKMDLFSIISVYLNTSFNIKNAIILDKNQKTNRIKNIYCKEFKNEIINMIIDKNISKSKVSINYNIPYSTITRWISKKNKNYKK